MNYKNVAILLLLFVMSLSFSVFASGLPEEWVKTHDGGTGRAVAVDPSGNVCVTGTTDSPSGGYDITTIKYDTNGNELWTRQYDGGFWDTASNQAIAIDSSGNVYIAGVTGDSYLESTVAIKYDREGNELWVRKYGEGSQNAAWALSVDTSGNVFVTGITRSSTGYDYLTVKYDVNGNELWAKKYNSGFYDIALSVAADSSGNSYVTGSSGTIKYDANGNELWVKGESGRSVVVEPSGNAYIVGDSGTIKYANNGDVLWLKNNSGSKITIDAAGNVYVLGTSEPDYLTTKYDTNGNEIWVKLYDSGANDIAMDIALDSQNNVYVTGSIYNSGPSDFATIKYDGNGNQLWVKRLDVGYHDAPIALAVDSVGNLFVTGFTDGPERYVTIKYPHTVAVDIDIKPGSYPNCINLGSNGVTPVAVLTTSDIDATSLDTSTVTFADTAAVNGTFEDVNGDGKLDVVLHYRTADLQLGSSDTSATLIGKTLDGRYIVGEDSVFIVPSKK